MGFRRILLKCHAGYRSENALFREMVGAFVPPRWAKLVIVVGMLPMVPRPTYQNPGDHSGRIDPKSKSCASTKNVGRSAHELELKSGVILHDLRYLFRPEISWKNLITFRR